MKTKKARVIAAAAGINIPEIERQKQNGIVNMEHERQSTLVMPLMLAQFFPRRMVDLGQFIESYPKLAAEYIDPKILDGITANILKTIDETEKTDSILIQDKDHFVRFMTIQEISLIQRLVNDANIKTRFDKLLIKAMKEDSSVENQNQALLNLIETCKDNSVLKKVLFDKIVGFKEINFNRVGILNDDFFETKSQKNIFLDALLSSVSKSKTPEDKESLFWKMSRLVGYDKRYFISREKLNEIVDFYLKNRTESKKQGFNYYDVNFENMLFQNKRFLRTVVTRVCQKSCPPHERKLVIGRIDRFMRMASKDISKSEARDIVNRLNKIQENN